MRWPGPELDKNINNIKEYGSPQEFPQWIHALQNHALEQAADTGHCVVVCCVVKTPWPLTRPVPGIGDGNNTITLHIWHHVATANMQGGTQS